MPTSQLETRAHNALPDIFKTLNGSHFDIGMFDHLRDSGSKVYTAPWGRGAGQPKELPDKQNFPRIILRDALGHELDTFTTLQEAIYRAKWNVKQTGQAKEPLEWRLPKAPPPARPDLTRTFPPLKHPPVVHPDGRVKTKWDHSRVLEFDVEDVGFVRESLQYLPFAPSLSFLRQEILVGPKTYFQIVGTMLLHNRVLSQTEKRQALYKFPGFCSGCIRMGICYGCERSSEVHFHEDKPVKTGGGFTYFKKDRPERENQRKNPINWKVRHPDKALKKLMEEYGGVELEGEIPAEIKRHLDEHGGHREKIVSIDCNDVDEFGNKRKRKANIHVSYNMDGNNEVTGGDLEESQGHGDHDLDITDVRVEMDYDGGDSGSDSEPDEPNVADGSTNQTEGYRKGGATRRMRKSRSTGRSKSEADMASEKQKHGSYTARSSGRDRSFDQHTDTDRMYENTTSDEENMERDNGTDSSSPNRSNKRKEKLYKPPPAFKIKKTTKRSIEARSPFSTNRSYDLPKGKGIDIKKSDKGPTQFKDFNKADASWKEPKKFELKKVEQKTTKFWSGSPKKKEEKRPTARRTDTHGDRSRGVRRVPSPRSISPDSGLESELLTDPKRVKARDRSHSVSVVNLTPSFFEDSGTNKSELEPVREETLTPTPEPNMGLSERAHTPLQLRVVTPAPEKAPPPVTPPPVEPPKPLPKKREIIKKEKKVKPPPEPKPRTPTPIAVEPTPTPPPIEEEKPVSRDISFVREPSLPKLPPIEVPELPEFQEVHTETKRSKKERKLIEVTPDLPEQKKKLPPPPKLGPRIKGRQTKRRKVAEAPVTSQELQQLNDPLDFLAKYCIINPDRLPYYERVFNSATNEQVPRYSRDQSPGGMVHLPPAQLSEHELNMLKDMTVITHAQTPRRDGLNVPEQYLEKLNYSIEFIKTKQETLHDHMHKLQAEKMRLMAQLAKEMDRDISRVDYKTKGGKKKKKDDDDSSPKKKKKKKGGEPDYDTMGVMSTSMKNFQPTKASDITDEVIVSRMDEKMLKKAKKDPIVKQFSIEISRDVEKLKNFDQRISQIEDEKDLVGLYCMDHYFAEQNDSQPPYAFRRQQSRLYQKLHPDPDVEMNIDEVETALQQINNKLLSEKEFQYIYFILDLPKREKITFRLFSIIAALSEKVTQMDPVIRKLLNKVDYNALDVKMDKSKELFELLQDEDLAPVGNAPAETLAVELTAGGLTPEHTSYVLSKFNREGRGFVDFLDFVTYVPLFVDIHKRIIEDPFNNCLDI